MASLAKVTPHMFFRSCAGNHGRSSGICLSVFGQQLDTQFSKIKSFFIIGTSWLLSTMFALSSGQTGGAQTYLLELKKLSKICLKPFFLNRNWSRIYYLCECASWLTGANQHTHREITHDETILEEILVEGSSPSRGCCRCLTW